MGQRLLVLHGSLTLIITFRSSGYPVHFTKIKQEFPVCCRTHFRAFSSLLSFNLLFFVYINFRIFTIFTTLSYYVIKKVANYSWIMIEIVELNIFLYVTIVLSHLSIKSHRCTFWFTLVLFWVLQSVFLRRAYIGLENLLSIS